VANGYISAIEASTMHRGVLHIETELRWHDELDALLAQGAPLSGSADRRGGAARLALSGGDSHCGADEMAAGGPSANGARLDAERT
jgi:hypothetical protein